MEVHNFAPFNNSFIPLFGSNNKYSFITIHFKTDHFKSMVNNYIKNPGEMDPKN